MSWGSGYQNPADLDPRFLSTTHAANLRHHLRMTLSTFGDGEAFYEMGMHNWQWWGSNRQRDAKILANFYKRPDIVDLTTAAWEQIAAAKRIGEYDAAEFDRILVEIDAAVQNIN